VISKNAWIVNGLYSPSNAEKSGLRIGNRILRINDIAVTTVTIENQKSYLE